MYLCLYSTRRMGYRCFMKNLRPLVSYGAQIVVIPRTRLMLEL